MTITANQTLRIKYVRRRQQCRPVNWWVMSPQHFSCIFFKISLHWLKIAVDKAETQGRSTTAAADAPAPAASAASAACMCTIRRGPRLPETFVIWLGVRLGLLGLVASASYTQQFLSTAFVYSKLLPGISYPQQFIVG